MASQDLRIDQAPLIGSVTGSELLPLASGGNNYSITVDQIKEVATDGATITGNGTNASPLVATNNGNIRGTGTPNQVAWWDGTNIITGDSTFTHDNGITQINYPSLQGSPDDFSVVLAVGDLTSLGQPAGVGALITDNTNSNTAGLIIGPYQGGVLSALQVSNGSTLATDTINALTGSIAIQHDATDGTLPGQAGITINDTEVLISHISHSNHANGAYVNLQGGGSAVLGWADTTVSPITERAFFAEAAGMGWNTQGTTFYLPLTDGTSGQFMKTDGSGHLSFASAAAPLPSGADYEVLSLSGAGSPLWSQTLKDASGDVSVNFFNRQVLYPNGDVALDWSSNLTINANNAVSFGSISMNNLALSNAGGNVVLNWGNTTLFDNSGLTSMVWNGRLAYDATGSVQSADWGNRLLTDVSAVQSVDWGNRLLDDAGNTQSADWGNRLLDDASAVQSADWGNRLLTDASAVQSADWGNRLLTDVSAVQSVDWGNRLLTDNAVVQSADWGNRLLTDASAVQSVDWGNRLLTDNAVVQSADWGNRLLTDASAVQSADWGNRLLNDASGGQSIDWGKRLLIDDSGTEVGTWSAGGITLNVGGFGGSNWGQLSLASSKATLWVDNSSDIYGIQVDGGGTHITADGGAVEVLQGGFLAFTGPIRTDQGHTTTSTPISSYTSYIPVYDLSGHLLGKIPLL